ncbi:MAG: ELM1/GtrOC1 family putative glycosyltransferase [Pseudomonadota bacterium]
MTAIDLEPLIAIAQAAGREILTHYGATIASERKADGSPVTAADHAAEALIVAGLAALDDTAIVSEEQAARGQAPEVADRPFWCVDPLDGTKEFIAKTDEFVVCIARIERGAPVLGVLYAPALGVTYAAAGPGTAIKIERSGARRPIAVRAVPAGGPVALDSRSHRDGAELDRWLEAHGVRERRVCGSALKFGLVAEGAADFYVRFGNTSEWDTAAGPSGARRRRRLGSRSSTARRCAMASRASSIPASSREVTGDRADGLGRVRRQAGHHEPVRRHRRGDRRQPDRQIQPAARTLALAAGGLVAPAAGRAAPGWRAAAGPPWPDLVITAGRTGFAPSVEIRRRAAGKTLLVAIQNPRMRLDQFDLIIAPAHDRLSGANVLVTDGAPHRVTPARLAEAARALAPQLAALARPIVAVLIGGSNRGYRLTAETATEIGGRLAEFARRHRLSLAVTPSRRTEPAVQQGAGAGARRPAAVLLGRHRRQPVFRLLGLADAVIVTADSVSMTSEAAVTGKPIYVLELPGNGGKFAAFHAHMAAKGITRPFTGAFEAWSYAPLDDMGRAAAAIRRLLAARDPVAQELAAAVR